jgi:hypothetical protein
LIEEIRAGTNVVCYDWELTGPRLEQWTYVAQLMRLLAGRKQLAGDSAAMQWLNLTGRQLGACETKITRSSDREFSLTRSSSVGFTALEIQLFMDWLESPEFPAGDGFVSQFHHPADANQVRTLE